MQWLTAILAFATTMLIFSMIVSTLVETIHRFLGSRSVGLKTMLQAFFRDVIHPYYCGTDSSEAMTSETFVNEMMGLRGTTAEAPESKPKDWFRQSFYLVTDLPVENFMERLGTSRFSAALDTAFKDKPEERERALKDIAQKFELYGQESGVHFERMARSWSLGVAFFVAWFFYVHPYDLLQTFLKQPDVAVKVAELNDESIEKAEETFREINEKISGSEVLQAAAEDDDTAEGSDQEELRMLLTEIKGGLEEANSKLEPLRNAGVPIGWLPSRTYCLLENFKGEDCWIKVPNNGIDFFWLIIGGLLVGLGAPFWAKAIRQITHLQGVSGSLTKILKPAQSSQTNQHQPAAPNESSVAEEAFKAAETGPKSSGSDR